MDLYGEGRNGRDARRYVIDKIIYCRVCWLATPSSCPTSVSPPSLPSLPGEALLAELGKRSEQEAADKVEREARESRLAKMAESAKGTLLYRIVLG